MSKSASLIVKIAVIAVLFGPAVYLVFGVATVLSALQGMAWFGFLMLPSLATWAFLEDLEKKAKARDKSAR